MLVIQGIMYVNALHFAIATLRLPPKGECPQCTPLRAFRYAYELQKIQGK